MTDPKNIWMIGDVQGCCDALDELLQHPLIANDENARFWFAGDLVNRGPSSRETLKRIMGLGDRAITVLGNHDLSLLATAAGLRKPGKSDTMGDILDAPDCDELINWLRHQPLAHFEHNHLLVHAGVLAQWDTDTTLALAAEVEAALRVPNWQRNLEKMFGNEPSSWREDLGPHKRRRVIINALTRIRMCNDKGQMEFSFKGSPAGKRNDGLMPWFDVPNRATRHVTVVFGHWSTLGLMVRPDAICLDTGCIWGGKLTAMRLHDHETIQVQCRSYQEPGTE